MFITLGLKRWLRSAHHILLTLLLLATFLCIPFASSASQQLIKEAVSDHWRGAYDILVLHPESEAIRKEGDKYILEPNYASITSPSITEEQVAKLAELDGVEVSAPIGFVGRLAGSYETLRLYIPMDYFQENPLTVLKANPLVTYNDGLTERYGSGGHSVVWRIDARNWDGQPEGDLLENTTLKVESSSGKDRTFWTVDEGYLSLYLTEAPHISTLITAIDPDAESKLLGNDNALGLQRLTAFESIVEELHNSDGSYKVPMREWTGEENWTTEVENIAPGFRKSYAYQGYFGEQAQFVPILYAQDIYPSVHLQGTLQALDIESPEADDWISQSQRKISGREIMSLDRDLTPMIKPLGQSEFAIIPQGATPHLFLANLANGSHRTEVSGLTFKSPSTQSDEEESGKYVPSTLATVVRDSYQKANPLSSLETTADGKQPGQTSAYRSSHLEQNQLGIVHYRYGGGQVAPVLVDSYNPQQVEENLGYSAPLGAYSSFSPVRVSDSNGQEIVQQELAPTLTGLGLTAQPATALTTITAARQMGIEEPVTAVRIRMADLEEYSDENIARLQTAVRKIEDMGLSAYIVAGASTTSQTVWVDSYAWGNREPTGQQNIEPLGAVELPIVLLNVAGDVVNQLGSLTDMLVFGSLYLVLGALFALLILGSRSYREDINILYIQGAGFRHRWLYLISLYSPILLVLALVFLGARLLANGYETTMQIISISSFIILSVILGLLALRTEPKQQNYPRTKKILPFGLFLPLTIGFLSSLLTLSAYSIPTVINQVESTELGKDVGQQTLPIFVGLLCISVITVCAVIGSSWAIGLKQRTKTLRILWEQGFSPTSLKRRVVYQWVRLVIPAASLSTLLLLLLGKFGLTAELHGGWFTMTAALTVLLTLPVLLLYIRLVGQTVVPRVSQSQKHKGV